MTSEIRLTAQDISGENSDITFVMASQGGAQTITDIASLVTAAINAVEGVSLMTVHKAAFRQLFLDDAATVPASQWANRESAATVYYVNPSGKRGHCTVFGPDLDNVARLTGTDNFDLTDTEMAALVSFIESYVQVQGAAVTVEKATYKGRNN